MIGQLAAINALLFVIRVISLAIGFHYFNFTLSNVTLTLLIVNILFLILFAYFAIKVLVGRVGNISLMSSFSVFKMPLGIKSFVKNSYFTSVSSIPTKELDISILGFYATPEVVGVYRMSKNFSAALWAFVDQIVLIVYADFARKFAQKNLLSIKKTIGVIGCSSIVLFLVGWTTAYIYLDNIIIFLLGEVYVDSVKLFLIIFAGAFIWGPLVWAAPLALTLNKPQIIFKASLLASILLVFLFFILTYYFGVLGTAIIYSLSPILVSIILITLLFNENGFRQILKC